MKSYVRSRFESCGYGKMISTPNPITAERRALNECVVQSYIDNDSLNREVPKSKRLGPYWLRLVEFRTSIDCPVRLSNNQSENSKADVKASIKNLDVMRIQYKILPETR
ncbi:hypothetical protein CEXT_349681 [Caerostris extrusa]|uniref:Uncharacterized protein n=1 Tax=Caerostris extrusa TaxID=172846 RepID=A0AAV4XKA6_CAEEX|nr:hypothetical protein CEXT_349681 [Caerostris extrusa]